MPCCTYLADEEIKQWTCWDTELRDLMREINGLPGQRWALREVWTNRKGIWKAVKVPLYELYSHVVGVEWQIINFPDGSGPGTYAGTERLTSINHRVIGAVVKAYLIGYLGGIAASKAEVGK